MPGPRPERGRIAADARLERALQAVARSLDAAGAPWAVIGGLAVIARGVRRMTTDIDAVVRERRESPGEREGGTSTGIGALCQWAGQGTSLA